MIPMSTFILPLLSLRYKIYYPLVHTCPILVFKLPVLIETVFLIVKAFQISLQVSLFPPFS